MCNMIFSMCYRFALTTLTSENKTEVECSVIYFNVPHTKMVQAAQGVFILQN